MPDKVELIYSNGSRNFMPRNLMFRWLSNCVLGPSVKGAESESGSTGKYFFWGEWRFSTRNNYHSFSCGIIIVNTREMKPDPIEGTMRYLHRLKR
jgi:hypothetical protein